MKLDVILAKSMLEETKNALKNSKSDDAITNLQAIQTEGVTFHLETVELPLAEAAETTKKAEESLNRTAKPTDPGLAAG